MKVKLIYICTFIVLTIFLTGCASDEDHEQRERVIAYLEEKYDDNFQFVTYKWSTGSSNLKFILTSENYQDFNINVEVAYYHLDENSEVIYENYLSHKYAEDTVYFIEEVVSNYFEDSKISYSFYDSLVHPSLDGNTTLEEFLLDESVKISFELMLNDSQFTEDINLSLTEMMDMFSNYIYDMDIYVKFYDNEDYNLFDNRYIYESGTDTARPSDVEDENDIEITKYLILNLTEDRQTLEWTWNIDGEKEVYTTDYIEYLPYNKLTIEDLDSSPVTDESMFSGVVEDGGFIIKSCLSRDDIIVVPETIDGYPVTEIGVGAFYYTTARGIALPDTINKIGQYAFPVLTELEILDLGSGIQEVSATAFSSFWNINTIVYSDNNNPSLRHFIGMLDIPGTCEIYVPDSVSDVEYFCMLFNSFTSLYTFTDTVTIYGSADSSAKNIAEYFDRTYQEIAESTTEFESSTNAGYNYNKTYEEWMEIYNSY